MLTGSAKEVQGELAETELKARVPVVLSGAHLPELISGELRVDMETL